MPISVSWSLPAFPVRCDLCGATGIHAECLCAECLNDLLLINSSCLRCGRPLLQDAPACGKCLDEPGLAYRSIAAFHYQYPVDALIKRLKYRQCIRLATPLSRILSQRLTQVATPLPEVMIPVPLHRLRLYQRGFNQSMEICRVLERRLHIPVDTTSVIRAKATRPMFDLSASERRDNIAGAFKITRPLAYQSVAIVDDVITSGSTVNELACRLRDAGVAKIELWALARTE
jgi:ComF family protein